MEAVSEQLVLKDTAPRSAAVQPAEENAPAEQATLGSSGCTKQGTGCTKQATTLEEVPLHKPNRCVQCRLYIALSVAAVCLFVAGLVVGALILAPLSDSESCSVFPDWGLMNFDHCTRQYGTSCQRISLTALTRQLDSAVSNLSITDRATTRLWHGNSTAYAATMTQLVDLLTERFLPWTSSSVSAELQLLEQMHSPVESSARTDTVIYLSRGLTEGAAPWPGLSQLDLYRAEDIESIIHFKQLMNASASHTAEWVDAVVEATMLCGAIGLRMKDTFQRARPYQTAFLLNQTSELQLLEASSATTPSLPSGHALQGYCAVAAILQLNISLSHDELVALFRLGHDVGDRRVLAGVHYPTDNYASAVIFNHIVHAAWPVAHAHGLRFGRSDTERALLCNGDRFPQLCADPILTPATAFEI